MLPAATHIDDGQLLATLRAPAAVVTGLFQALHMSSGLVVVVRHGAL
jgi:hypothetical protein